ncbi:MAG: PLP-dependent aminotransferase family protein [Nitriliruptoraceae bacterium]
MDDPIRESGPHLAALLTDALRGNGPLYRLLAGAIKRAIDRGEIPLGTVLPPERSLANELAVSRATVVAAYDRLKAEGWLESRQGSGTWVRTNDEPDRKGVDAVATGRLFLGPSASQGLSGDAGHPAHDDLIELSVAAVMGSPVVTEAVTSLTADEINTLTAHHGYVPQGLRTLRDIVAANFSNDGLPTHPDQVIITTGAHQALSLVARQVLKPGDDVLVESPTFPGALDVFRRFGARAIPLPVDEHGARTDVVADLMSRTQPMMIYVSPHFHNPTGTIMPAERRRELGELAAAAGIVIVEDMALADVAIDDVTLPPSIAAIVPDATVHTIGSTAKLYWAGMRIGWLRSPEAWGVRMLATKTVADLGSPLLAQLITVKMLARRDEVREQRRQELLPRRELMCQRLEEWLGDWTWRRPPGGLSMWVTLPHGNADEFAELALRQGVAIVPGPSLSVDEGNRQSIRLVFARPEEHIEEGLRRLAGAWERYSEQTAGRPTARLLV